MKEKIIWFLSPLLVITSGTCRKMHFVSLTSFVRFSNILAFSIPFIQRISLFICKYCIFISQVGNACSAEEVSTSQKGLSEYCSSGKTAGCTFTGTLDRGVEYPLQNIILPDGDYRRYAQGQQLCRLAFAKMPFCFLKNHDFLVDLKPLDLCPKYSISSRSVSVQNG